MYWLKYYPFKDFIHYVGNSFNYSGIVFNISWTNLIWWINKILNKNRKTPEKILRILVCAKTQSDIATSLTVYLFIYANSRTETRKIAASLPCLVLVSGGSRVQLGRLSYGSIISQFHAVFWKFWLNRMLAQPGGFNAPFTENPGAAPASGCKKIARSPNPNSTEKLYL